MAILVVPIHVVTSYKTDISQHFLHFPQFYLCIARVILKYWHFWRYEQHITTKTNNSCKGNIVECECNVGL